MTKKTAEALAQRIMTDWQPMGTRAMKMKGGWAVIVSFTDWESYTFYTTEQFEDYGKF